MEIYPAAAMMSDIRIMELRLARLRIYLRANLG